MPTASLTDHVALQTGGAPGGAPASYLSIYEDFLPTAGATLPVPWGKQDTSPAGTPTLDYISNSAAGEYKMLCDNTNEAQKITLYFADQRVIDITKGPIFEARIKIDGTAGAVLPVGTRWVCGLASARNATLDSVTINAWFRCEGAGAGRSIGYESDDNTTDAALASSGVSYAESTYVKLRVDCTTLSAVAFYINDVLVGTTSAPLATGNVQPFIELQKDSGTGTPQLTVDYVKVRVGR